MVELWREFVVRRLFGLSHEQYLDEPAVSTSWMLELDRVQGEAIREAQERHGG